MGVWRRVKACCRADRNALIVDLMAPNLNKAKVQVKAQMARESAKTEANNKKERDRAALEKQRCVDSARSIDTDSDGRTISELTCIPCSEPTKLEPSSRSRKRRKSKSGEHRLGYCVLVVATTLMLSPSPAPHPAHPPYLSPAHPMKTLDSQSLLSASAKRATAASFTCRVSSAPKPKPAEA